MWLKFLLVVIIGYFLITRVFKFFYKTLTGNEAASNQQKRNTNSYQSNDQRERGTRIGNIYISFRPKGRKGAGKTANDYKGGEYVEYEEVD